MHACSEGSLYGRHGDQSATRQAFAMACWANQRAPVSTGTPMKAIYRTWLDESPLAGRAIAVSVVDFCPVAGQDGWALLLPLVTLIGCGCVCLPCAWALPGGVAEEY
jgi:hypothetical protein